MKQNPLKLTIPIQRQTNWCWAATTVGVHTFVNEKTGTPLLTQCEVVERRLDRDDCCVDPATLPAACNVQSGLTLPLHEAECHVVTYANQTTLKEIVNEIDQDAPVCARVVWEQGFGNGHFVVIFGYLIDEEKGIADVIVYDSVYGWSVQTFESFRKYYRTPVQTPQGVEQNEATWTHTYFVTPQKTAPRERLEEVA